MTRDPRSIRRMKNTKKWKNESRIGGCQNEKDIGIAGQDVCIEGEGDFEENGAGLNVEAGLLSLE